MKLREREELIESQLNWCFRSKVLKEVEVKMSFVEKGEKRPVILY